MARSIRSSQLETRTQRLKLAVRRQPYVVRVAVGIRLGYRRNAGGAGSWSAVCADGAGSTWIRKLAIADDYETSDGKNILDYWQASDAARKVGRRTNSDDTGERPLTVAEALDQYEADLKAHNQNPDNATTLRGHMKPAFAARPVTLLTAKEVYKFRTGLLATGVKPSTANRYMHSLCAALSLAARLDERIANTRAWKLKALPDTSEADHVNAVILTEPQVHASIRAAYELAHAFGLHVETLAVCGCRPVQARRMIVSDLQDLPDGTWRLLVPSSKKGGRGRQIERRPLPVPAGLALRLRAAAAGRASNEPLLLDPSGRPWNKQGHAKPWKQVARVARLPAAATVYRLRDASIIRALLKGIPTRLVASMHDTSTAILERHYARFIQTDPTAALMLASQVNFDPTEEAGDKVIPLVR
jgi:hypothetical protein